MKSYRFYSVGDLGKVIARNSYPGIKTPIDLYHALSHVWCQQSCAPRLREKWDESNMTLGQCSITAFLAQDIFGGKVFGIPLGDGNFHCFNAVDDAFFDLTSEQFGNQKLDYEHVVEQTREIHFQKEEKRLRYKYLKEHLKEYCLSK